MKEYDVVVVGAGPGGLAAAVAARKNGAEKVLVLDRNPECGGVLLQCIHDGFGLVRYKEALTGPEYAVRASQEAVDCGIEISNNTAVTGITHDRIVTAVRNDGLLKVKAGAVVLATGCRERTRGALSIPGTRPAGVYTAGVVQNLVNIKNIMIGKRVVILGSGDIGLIMARRLTLEGAKVLAVLEIMPQPCGLQRNISQCLYDFGIPIHVGHTVSKIIGKKKLEAIEYSKVDENLKVIPRTATRLECDSLVLSVGLIPENEVALSAGVALDAKNNGVVTDEFLQTSVEGIFACGNCRRVMDLADLVSQQGELAGRNAASFISGKPLSINEEKSSSFKKGFPPADTVICPLCPNGCSVTFTADGSVEGNRCKRGAAYLNQERIDPRRTLTTTVKSPDGSLRPVKIPDVRKTELIETVRKLNAGEMRHLIR